VQRPDVVLRRVKYLVHKEALSATPGAQPCPTSGIPHDHGLVHLCCWVQGGGAACGGVGADGGWRRGPVQPGTGGGGRPTPWRVGAVMRMLGPRPQKGACALRGRALRAQSAALRWVVGWWDVPGAVPVGLTRQVLPGPTSHDCPVCAFNAHALKACRRKFLQTISVVRLFGNPKSESCMTSSLVDDKLLNLHVRQSLLAATTAHSTGSQVHCCSTRSPALHMDPPKAGSPGARVVPKAASTTCFCSHRRATQRNNWT
jgi:hypothetical protein